MIVKLRNIIKRDCSMFDIQLRIKYVIYNQLFYYIQIYNIQIICDPIYFL